MDDRKIRKVNRQIVLGAQDIEKKLRIAGRRRGVPIVGGVKIKDR